MMPCMGGWCTRRSTCPNYHAGREGVTPDDRLCLPGREGEPIVQPRHVSRVHRAAPTSLRGRMVAWLDERPDEFLTTDDLAVKFGANHNLVRALMSQAARAGEVDRDVGGGQGHPTTYRSKSGARANQRPLVVPVEGVL